MPSSRSLFGSQINAGKVVKEVLPDISTPINPTYKIMGDYGRLKLAQDKYIWLESLGGGAALFPVVASTKTITTTGSWSSGDSIQSNGSSQIVLIGSGGGSGQRSSLNQSGGAGAVVVITLPAGTYNVRAWPGIRGLHATSSVNVDNSGYGANGGAGGSFSGGTGGQGGTPSIVELTSDGSTFNLFAMAGAGGGGGQHSNTSSARGGGGGSWFNHNHASNQLVNSGLGFYRGTLGGGYGGALDDLAGANTANTYNAGTG